MRAVILLFATCSACRGCGRAAPLPDTASPGETAAPLADTGGWTDLRWRLHEGYPSLVYVSWEQARDANVHVEYCFDGDEWLQSPETQAAAGEVERLLVGIPYQTEAAWLHDQIRALRHQAAERVRVDRLVGETPATRRARAQVVLASRNRASVLVVGPTGSGRQHVAEAIHYAARSATPGSLIPLACSVLGADLIRSTVAALASRRPPPGEVGGTLLLNEADQIPPEVQAEMAKAFSAKSFPMRLIATARRSLDDLARGGKYRADLASVLSTIVIELAPLAERRGDLPLLAQLFLEDANARGTKQLAGFSPEALDRLDPGWTGWTPVP